MLIILGRNSERAFCSFLLLYVPSRSGIIWLHVYPLCFSPLSSTDTLSHAFRFGCRSINCELRKSQTFASILALSMEPEGIPIPNPSSFPAEGKLLVINLTSQAREKGIKRDKKMRFESISPIHEKVPTLPPPRVN
jgi:hypothetical protein